MASKYPGISILYEIGSRADVAQAYGVSERTIYRWLDKAAKESGEKPKPKFPGSKLLANFKGTRKQAAAKFGVSERTIYRWLNKAREQGQQIPSRLPSSKNPGVSILDEPGTNSTIAKKFGVSTRTVQRWKQQAREEVKKSEPEFDSDEWKKKQEEITAPDDSIFEEPEFEEPEFEEEELGEMPEEIFTEDQMDPIEGLINTVLDHEELLAETSLFRTLTPEEQKAYMEFYIQYQYDMDEHQFYNEETHKMDFSPDFVSTINIWGEEFEDWVTKQYEYSVYG